MKPLPRILPLPGILPKFLPHPKFSFLSRNLDLYNVKEKTEERSLDTRLPPPLRIVMERLDFQIEQSIKTYNPPQHWEEGNPKALDYWEGQNLEVGYGFQQLQTWEDSDPDPDLDQFRVFLSRRMKRRRSRGHSPKKLLVGDLDTGQYLLVSNLDTGQHKGSGDPNELT